MIRKQFKRMIENKFISLILLILWSLLIFFLSNQSSEVSSFESSYLISHTLRVNDGILNFIHEPLRELMHFIEYFIFGMLLFNTLNNYKIKKKFILSIIISFTYIVLDEIHQIFIPGRAFEILDIILDLLGATISIYILNKFIYKK